MRALPGPAQPAACRGAGGAGYAGGGFQPQPMVASLILVAPLVLLLGVDWGVDLVTGVWCPSHGCAPTSYLREAFTVLGEGAAAAAALVALVVDCRRGWPITRWLLLVDALVALIVARGVHRYRAARVSRRADALARRTTVHVEVADLPRQVTAGPAATYPMPDLAQVIDTEVVA